MSTDTTWHYATSSSAETEQLGAKLGKRLRGGEVIELRSDLGGGKTTLVRGIASGAGSQDAVGSPSFTISREYRAGELTIHHYDFYRLHDAGIMGDELRDVMSDPKAVVIVEWADVVADVLPTEHLTITIMTAGDDGREFAIDMPQAYDYLRGDD